MDKLIKEEFFKEFSIDEDYFLSTGLDWNELENIYEDYIELVPLLEKEAEYIVSKLIDVPKNNSNIATKFLYAFWISIGCELLLFFTVLYPSQRIPTNIAVTIK